MVAPEMFGDRKRRRIKQIVNVFATAAMIGSATTPIIVHALDNAPPTQGIGQTDNLKHPQRVKRPHGGDKITGPSISGSKTLIAAEKTRTTFTRGSKVPDNSVHHLYSSRDLRNNGRQYSPFAPNVSVKQQQAILGSSFEHRAREEVKGKTQEILRLISNLEQFVPTEARMLRETLIGIEKGKLPADLLPGLQQQIAETFNRSLEKVVQKASIQDFQRCAQFDFSCTPIALLIDELHLDNNQRTKIEFLSEEISNFVNTHEINLKTLEKDLSQLFSDFENNFDLESLTLTLGITPAILMNLISSSPALLDHLRKSKKTRNTALIISGVLTVACIGSVIATPFLTATSPPPIGTNTPDSIGIPTPSAEIGQTSPVIFQNIEINVNPFLAPSPLHSGANIIGGVSGAKVENNNPGYLVPYIGGRHECNNNALVRSNTGSIVAYQIDEESIRGILKAKMDPLKGDLVIGSLPDGTPVELIDGIWMIKKSGQRLFLNPIIASREGQPFGFPCLVQDSSGNFFIGIIDDNGALVEDSNFESAFISAKDIATQLGYSGSDLGNIASIGYDGAGNLIIKDAAGNVLNHLAYLNPLLLPPATATLESSPLPTEAQTWVANHPEFHLQEYLGPAGLNVDFGEGKVVSVPPDQITARLKVGQEDALQIYNETGDKILAAFDPETKAWVDADRVIWKGKTPEDKLNAENYVHVKTWAELKELIRLEKHFLPPFPENTYFPPLDKIIVDYYDYDNYGDESAEFNVYRPFGYLPTGATAPFRFINFIVLEKNPDEGRMLNGFLHDEQIYNPADGSFSVLHFGPIDGTDEPRSIKFNYEITKGDLINIPLYSFFDKSDLNSPLFVTILKYLRENNYMDASGNMPRIKELVRVWLTTGHVPPELENIFLIDGIKRFIPQE